jgi:hypothetical protein
MSLDAEFDLLNAVLAFAVRSPDIKSWQRLWQKLDKSFEAQGQTTAHSEYFNFLNYVHAKSQKQSYEQTWKENNKM